MVQYSLVLSALALAAGWRLRCVSSGGWLALAILGQAAALQLVDAGWRIHYQHYRLRDLPALALGIVIAQALVVAAGTWRTGLAGRMLRFTAPWKVGALALVMILPSAVVSREVGFFAAELLFAGAIQLVNLFNIALVVASLPEDLVERSRAAWLRGTAAASPGPPKLVLVAAGFAVVASLAAGHFAYERHPHLEDEVVYLQHARILATGSLAQAAPPVPDAFPIYLMEIDNERWYPVPPPGWPAVLAIGVWLGVPWLVNPLLAGANVLLVFHVLKFLSDSRGATAVALLQAISPWNLFLGMTLMNHAFTLTCMLVAVLGICQARSNPAGRSAIWTAASGAAVGMSTLLRPLDGIVIGVWTGLWAIGVGGKRLRFSSLATFGAGVLLVASLGLAYNAALTGSPTRFPLMAYMDKHFGPNSNAMGFGPERGLHWPMDPYPGHGLGDAAVNSALNIASINVELLGWSIGSLLPLGILLVCGRLEKVDWQLLAVILLVFTAHIFYWYSGGPDFGARYWYLMVVPCIALSVRGLAVAGQSAPAAARIAVAAALLCLLSVLVYSPWRATDKYFRYLNARPDVRGLAETHRFGRSLVLVRGDHFPDYASAFVYNPLDWTSPAPIYAWDRSPAVRAELLRVYADRTVFFVDGPAVTKQGYRVSAGPLAAAAAGAFPHFAGAPFAH